MLESHAYLLLHIIFSTRDRIPAIDAELSPRLHAYLATVVNNAGCECFLVGGAADHVHMAVRLSRGITVSDLMEKAKSNSSRWAREMSRAWPGWQNGYGAFSVSQKGLPALLAYIEGQEEHHRHRSFQDEYREMLTEHGIEFNEAYVWG